jgi:hypothetical protein
VRLLNGRNNSRIPWPRVGLRRFRQLEAITNREEFISSK